MQRSTDTREPHIVLHGVTFDEYSALRDAFDRPSLRMTYCEGVLELMSPSEAHEDWKKGIARVLEHWVFLLDIPVNAHGSPTFRKRAVARGAEPDECWVVCRIKVRGSPPDIVLEVVHSKSAISKLKVYDAFRVPEVWLFDDGVLSIHRHKARGGYRKVPRSTLLPQIDIDVLVRLARLTDQHTALKQLERHLRRR